ncbi:hypothetical protein KHA80_18690 [Anaerobacillus sp. HL2]|nr:hypothetical protein KHA80_18690 [Anaerobacillus sp. HL2]
MYFRNQNFPFPFHPQQLMNHFPNNQIPYQFPYGFFGPNFPNMPQQQFNQQIQPHQHGPKLQHDVSYAMGMFTNLMGPLIFKKQLVHLMKL